MKTWGLATVVISLAACMANEPARLPQEIDLGIQWPQAPMPAKIKYIKSFYGPKDLELRSSGVTRFWKRLTGAENIKMVRPYAVAATQGLIAVGDPGANGVHLFNTASGRYRFLDRAGVEFIASPVGVVIGENRLYISDSELALVLVFNLDGKFLFSVDRFQRPTGLTWDSSRAQLYIADTLAHKIVVLDADGNEVFSFGQRGKEDSQFNFPTHLTASSDALLVNDSMNFRIQRFNLEGELTSVFGTQGDSTGFLSQPKGIGIDSEGHIYVAGATTDHVQIFSDQGEFLLAFGGNGKGPGQFVMPTGLSIYNDIIYVADSYNQRVQMFRYLPDE